MGSVRCKYVEHGLVSVTDLSQIPTATYRLQLNRTFTFRDAAGVVPYLATLGISHCYVSPYLRARPGSMHGYDIIDHNSLNPEIGTPEDYEYFVNELHRHGMGQILDIVPNHMGVMGADNAWWLDVLENGEASDYAEFFDIDWDPIKDELQGKVLIPILADQYGNELERGELKLVFDLERGEFSIFYHQHRFPVDPTEYPRILAHDLARLEQKLTSTNEEFLELQSIATAFSHLPGRRGLTAEQRSERNREKEVQKRRLAALCARSGEIREFIAANVAKFNGEPGESSSFELLHDLIKAQAYRLAQWRVAADDINYRRFFDINDLAALRQENEDVFNQTHRFILELITAGKVDGLRIDHPDGLYDPAEYFRWLRERLTAELNTQHRRIYLVAEKILTGRERLRRDWPLDGTTGYEFATLVNGLFVNRASADRTERFYHSFTGRAHDFADQVYACKKLILKVGLASELNVLANLLIRIALANRHTCDFTLNSLRSALSEIIACFPVYRTYVSDREVSEEDRRYVEQAVVAGRRRSNAPDLSVFDFIRRMLLVEVNGIEPAWYKRAILRFAMKFQQVTAAVMAKGLEDTALYRYNRLVSLNEVGGSPAKFGTSVEEFHRANEERLAEWPHSMLASSTHDSKRSEDVRARINVLSEMPSAWRLRVMRWRDWNRGKKIRIDGALAPSTNDEYLLYQTLIGTWPGLTVDDDGWKTFRERIQQYMLKAVREAKERTSWANANTEYEEALSAFIQAILERTAQNLFPADFSAFQRRVALIGMFNSLSQCTLKMTSPGVPDIYEGNELLEFFLVDPDNRRPVDYARRKILLNELIENSHSPERSKQDIADFLVDPENPKLKVFLTWKVLCTRKAAPDLFQRGQYIPLRSSGPRSENIVAFAREHEGRRAIVAVPRLCGSLLGDHLQSVCDAALWGSTGIEIPESKSDCYHNVFTGECIPASGQREIPAARLLGRFPVALLLSEPASGGADGEGSDCRFSGTA
jgi:(1->4)-alpha-D-glucan 1-alpha-D-glucosylmutase